MLTRFDYVHVTLSDGSTRQGYLVAIDGDVGTLVEMSARTAFSLSASTITVERRGSQPLPLPEQPYRIGDRVKFPGSNWQGTIIAVIPDFEASGEPGYSVRLDVEAVGDGALSIETIAPRLIEPIPAKPYICRDCSKPLSFPETIFVGDTPYCSEHAPSYDKHDQF